MSLDQLQLLVLFGYNSGELLVLALMNGDLGLQLIHYRLVLVLFLTEERCILEQRPVLIDHLCESLVAELLGLAHGLEASEQLVLAVDLCVQRTF